MEYQYRCNDCPFATDDPMGVDGHENHAPANGWLGRNERHTMYSVTERRAVADAIHTAAAAAHTRSCWNTHPGETHLAYVARWVGR